VVGIGDCDADYRGGARSYEVKDEAATTTLLIGDVTPWRRYRVVVSTLYSDTVHAVDIVAEINSTQTGQIYTAARKSKLLYCGLYGPI